MKTRSYIRYQMKDLRSTHQIDYFLDEVWDLGETIDLLEELATDTMLCRIESELLNELKGEVDYYWLALQTKDIKMDFLELDERKAKELFRREDTMYDALVFMDNAIYENEMRQIGLAAHQLKDIYFEYLSVFGGADSTKPIVVALH